MNVTPRPITFSDNIDKSRDVLGFSKWGQSSRTVNFIMFLLGWFTIPAEVLLRRDFGQRWFTTVNFYAGLFIFVILATLQYIAAALWGADGLLHRIQQFLSPFRTIEEPSFEERIMDRSMIFFLLAYVLMGSYHLFRIWWRNRTNTALHSFDDGTSRVEPLAGYMMRLLNTLTVPFVLLYRRLLPRIERVAASTPKLIHDRRAFTNTVFEPFLLFLLSFWVSGMASIWLFISAVALAIHANWKETAKLNKMLDFRDSMIEAKAMMLLNNSTGQNNTQDQMMQQAADNIKQNPQVAPYMARQYPDLMSIIEEMNKDKSHLG
jgi:hypothetical protein